MNPAIRRDSRFSAGRRLRPLALAAASLFALASTQAAGPALPTGMAIVQGQASTALNGNRLTVTNSAGALLDWQQFNIGAGAAVHFAQPSAASRVLNRVVGNDPTSILGSLSSNGQVWLQNPNGVLFGQGARIDVASLVATTLAINNTAWQDGLRSGSFRLGDGGAALGGIVNQGELRSASGGQVLLVGGAGGVRNEGLIHAPDGQVLLAAGAQVDLVDTSLPRLGVRLQAPQGAVLNLGQVLAGGGRVDLQAAMVNQQGIVRADAIGPGGAVVATASESLTLGAGSVTSASGAAGGQVALDAGAGALLASGRIDATASTGVGGQVSLLGRQVGLLDGGAIDASGWAGGGAVRLGGGLRGQDAAFRNADATFFGRGASIRADATGRGDGGLVVLWGSDAMRAYGTLSARGGALGGDGGFIETSGHWIDARPLAVDARAPAGRAGQWLLDPTDLLIVDGAGFDSNISGGPSFTTNGDPAVLSTDTMAAALNAGTSVTVTTGVAGSGFGDILMSGASLSVAPPNAVSLTFNALGNISMQASLIESTASPLAVQFNAGAGGGVVGVGSQGSNGGGIVIADSRISTRGGDITLGGASLACGPMLGCTSAGAAIGADSRLTKAIETSFSTLDAGSGTVSISGFSVVDSTASVGVRIADTGVSGGRILIDGRVDAAGDNYRAGVELWNASMGATGQFAINGTASAPTPPVASALVGINMINGSQLFINGASAALSMTGTATGGTGTAEGAGLLIGIQLADDSTRITATNGAAVDLIGLARGEGFRVGISTSSRLLAIDATGGSSLSLTSDNRLVLNADMVAPTGGSLLLRGGEGVFIDDMRLSGAPATALLDGSTVAIGTQGLTTEVSFEGVTALTLRGDQFLLGSSDNSGSLATGPGTEAQALSFTPPTGLQTLLASGGNVRVQADFVQIYPSAAVYSSAEGTAIDIAGRNAGASVLSFTNLSGNSALQAPSGRWLVHAADSPDGGSFLPDGLVADFWQYADTPGTTAPARGGNGFLYASTPLLSLAGNGALSRVYDGTTTVDLAAAGLAVAGLRTGQVSVGTPQFVDANAGPAKAVTLVAAPGGSTVVTTGGTPVYGYGTDAATMRGTISSRPLTLLAATASDKVYDANFNVQVTNWTLGNVVNGDDVRVDSGFGTITGNNPGVGSKSVVAQITTLGGAAAANYTGTGLEVATTANVTPRPLNLQSVVVADKVYDGGTTASVSSWALGNLVNDDDVRVLTGSAAFATAAAGTAKPVSATVLTLGGADAGNYSASNLGVQATGNITPRPLGLQSVVVADKVYDGSVAATPLNWVLSNVVGNDQVQVSSGNAVFASAAAGGAKPVTATVTALGGSAAANYSAQGLSTQASGNITPRPLGLSTVVVPDRMYDGTLTAVVSNWVLSNVIGEDDVRVASGTAQFLTPGAGTAKPVTATVGSLGGAAAGNYSATGVQAATTATITPRTLFVSSLSVADKVYDGTLSATVNGWTLGNVVGQDDVQVNGGTAQFFTAGAGVAKPVVATAGALSGADAANYTAAGLQASSTASITPRPLALQSVSLADKVYDGSVAATVASWRLGNVVGEDDVALSGVSAVFASPNAGSARPATALAGSLVGAAAANYSADGLTAQTTGNITPRPLTLESVTVADKVYDGGTGATVTAWRLAGVLEGDRVQVQTGSATFGSAGVGSAKPVTATVATLGGTSGANYSAAGQTAQATASITPATLTYLADALTLHPGDVLPVLTGRVTGFVGADSLAGATSGTLGFSTEASTSGELGRYAITGSGLSAANYVFVQAATNSTALTLAIAPQPPLVLPPEPTVTSSVASTTATAVVAVLAPTVASTPASGRALDAVEVLAPSAAGGDGSARRFDSLDLDRMSAGTVAMALAARDAYKNEVFKAAKDELAANPAVADAPGCASQQQAASGQCLLVRPLGGTAEISNARVVERAPLTPPGFAPAPPPATAPAQAAAAPAPARPVAPAAPAVAAAPAAPAAPAIRIQPMPPDLAINLPQRQAVARAAVPQIQRKIAVLIGIDRYQDERIPQLGNAVADARAVARTLTERLGYETVVLENPGKATIFRTLNQLAGQVGPNDSVVLYYAGHGERVEKTGLGYWQPADADAGRAESWISNADIDRLLRQLPASQLAMVSDSCFSGSLVSGERIRGVPATPDPASLLSKRAVVVMTSGGNEPVFDAGLNGHSPFAWNLMQSLNQVGNQTAGWKPGSSVFEQVRFAVARKLPQRPQYGASSGGGHEQGADYLFEQRQLR